MIVRQLTSDDPDIVKPLFLGTRYMGVNSQDNGFPIPGDEFNSTYFDSFCNTYLSDLQSYKAFGSIENGVVTATIAFYESNDGAEWYWTQIRSTDSSHIPAVLDAVIAHNEANGRFKFYSLFNNRYARTFRKLAFSEYNAERYDSFDEFVVPARTKCLYNLPWQILFNRSLLPVDALVRCSFLKQQYRTPQIGGNL